MFDRPSRTHARTSYPLCLLVLVLGACTTEVQSLTHVEASLEARPGLAPFQASHFARGGAPWPMFQDPAADELQIYFDGQPMLSHGHPVAVSSSEAMISFHVPDATGAFGFARDGEMVATSETVELSPDRFNYVIVHGEPDEPEVLAISTAREPRRVRLANVRPDGADLELVLLDAGDMPLTDPMPLPHGTVWTEVVEANVAAVRVIGEDASIDVRVSCDPAAVMVAYDEPTSDYSSAHTTPFLGLLGPTEPGGDGLEQCFDPDCSCEDID
jgi:hypothetical protein